jgi:hypothetical protein
VNKVKLIIFVFLFVITDVWAQLPPVFDKNRAYQEDTAIRKFLDSVRVLWKSAEGGIINEEKLLQKGNGQADLNSSELCILKVLLYIKTSHLVRLW